MSRKIFNFDKIDESKIIESLGKKADLYENSISACGCLFYKINDGKLQLLLISYTDPGWPKLDDFGGRIDDTDLSVFEAIARETSEETNHVINKKFMLELLPTLSKTFYNKQSKYFVVLHEVDNLFFNNTKVFGDFETADKLYRTVHWFDYDIAKPKLSMRLLCNLELITHLDLINKMAKNVIV